MTTAADDRAAEDAFEALLAGRPAPGGAAGLAAFTGAVRDAADRPGRPNAALAELLSTGLLTDPSNPSARTAPAAGIPSGSRGRTRRRFTVIVPALIAKFLAAGAVAQAAAGAGVVVVVVAGAGTAGALPEDAQTAFSDLTGIGETTEEPTDVLLPPTEEVVVPVEGDGSLDPTDPTLPVVEVPESTDDEPTDAEKAAAWAEAGKAVTTQAEFKAWLAEGKEQGWVTGQAVSAAAHARNEARKAARADVEDTEETPEVEEPEVEEPEVEDPEEDADEEEDGTEVESEDSGKGKGGKGKSRD